MSLYPGICGGYGVPGPPGPSGKGNMTWRGEWAAGTYNQHDLVSDAGVLWIAKRDGVTLRPPGTAGDWDFFAEQTAAATTCGGVVDLTPVPIGNDPMVIAMTEQAPMRCMTVTGGALSADNAGGWRLAGRLWLNSSVEPNYAVTLRCWLAWTENGVPLTSAVDETSGIVGLTEPFNAPVAFDVDIPENIPVSLMCKIVETVADTPNLRGSLGVTQFPRPSGSFTPSVNV